jgi:hypothetical protein
MILGFQPRIVLVAMAAAKWKNGLRHVGRLCGGEQYVLSAKVVASLTLPARKATAEAHRAAILVCRASTWLQAARQLSRAFGTRLETVTSRDAFERGGPVLRRVLAIRCLFGHTWGGCVCTRCGSVSGYDKSHTWVGCKCAQCGQTTRAYYHANGNVVEHQLVGCQCSICGGVIHDWGAAVHYMVEESRTCRRCSITHWWIK